MSLPTAVALFGNVAPVSSRKEVDADPQDSGGLNPHDELRFSRAITPCWPRPVLTDRNHRLAVAFFLLLCDVVQTRSCGDCDVLLVVLLTPTWPSPPRENGGTGKKECCLHVVDVVILARVGCARLYLDHSILKMQCRFRLQWSCSTLPATYQPRTRLHFERKQTWKKVPSVVRLFGAWN